MPQNSTRRGVIKEGYEILKSAGFSYITVYEKRKPKFIKIG
jgi:hypothetical protein